MKKFNYLLLTMVLASCLYAMPTLSMGRGFNRPLPPTPKSQRPLPPTPTSQKTIDLAEVFKKPGDVKALVALLLTNGERDTVTLEDIFGTNEENYFRIYGQVLQKWENFSKNYSALAKELALYNITVEEKDQFFLEMLLEKVLKRLNEAYKKMMEKVFSND